jgi:kumamolisin
MRRNIRVWPSTLGLGVCLLLGTGLTARIHAASTSPVSRPESIVPVTATNDVGPPDPHKPTITRRTLKASERNASMLFQVSLKLRNFSELQQRINRGDIISAKEMQAKYAPLPDDYQAATTWLKGLGFKVAAPDAARIGVFATGTIDQVAKQFQVTFARVAFQGQEYTSAITAPVVPADLSPTLVGVVGLQPYRRMHHRIVNKPLGIPSGPALGYQPSQILAAYKANFSAGINGAGQTIAIVIDEAPLEGDYTSFWTECGINQSPSNVQIVPVDTGTPSSDSALEAALDTEWSSSLAPGAQIRVYVTGDLTEPKLQEGYAQIYSDAVNHPEYGLHQMSMSFGGTEDSTVTASDYITDAEYYAFIVSAGVTIFASTGDNGSTDGGTSNHVEFPASDPNVTAAGGTTVTINGSNVITSETAWSGSGGGTSVQFNRPVWQTGTGVPAGTKRCIPDVACPADPNTGAVVVLNGANEPFQVGGTSWSSPTWAAFCALINEARINAGLQPLGLLTPKLYPLIGTSNFNDITSGSNGGFNAGVGYDQVTGIGTPNVGALAQSLSVQSSPAVSTIAPGAGTTFTASTTGTATGYQWQRMPIGTTTWSNVTGGNYSGATSASLTVSGATTAMSGDQFQCLVTTSAGTVASATSSTLVVDTPLIISTFAGQAGVAGAANGTGTGATLNIPSGVATDGNGNVYVADFSNNVIRKITPDGVVSTPYGNGTAGLQNGMGTNTEFNGPNSVAYDGAGNLYVADTSSNTIRAINLSTQQVTTLAGNGTAGRRNSSNGASEFNQPEGVAVDPTTGNVIVADTGNNMIRKITLSTSHVSTLAGSSTFTNVNGTMVNYGWIDATGGAAYFNGPVNVAIDPSGNIYVTDTGNDVIRKVTSAGVVTTPYGRLFNLDTADGIGSNASFNVPLGIWCDSSGNLYVADSQIPPTLTSTAAGNNLIRRINPNGVVSTIAGNAGVTGHADGTGTAATFYNPQSIVEDSQGTFYIADAFNDNIRKGLTALPVVTIAATQPNAAVYGPVNGTFTVTRTGSTFPTLGATESAGGTAVSGADYTAIPGTVTIAPGTTSAAITVSPLFNNQTTSKTVQLSLSSSSAYTIGSPGSDTVTIAPPTPYQGWQLANFGSNAYNTSTSGDLADPNGNGVPNLLEYALGGNPLQTGSNPSPTLSTVQVSGQNYLAITFTEISDPSLTYTVQVSTDLVNWTAGGTLYSSTPISGGTQVTYRDTVALPQSGATNVTARFMRLQVTGP